MNEMEINDSQRRAAKVAGAGYLIAMAIAVFADSYARSKLFVHGNPMETAQRILANETLFRLSIAGHVIISAIDLALITGLYVILKPVNRNLALFAVLLRTVETAVLTTTSIGDFNALPFFKGPDYLKSLDTASMHALGMAASGGHGVGFQVAFLFLGLGSVVFGVLWWKSRYIPRAISALGIGASALLCIGSMLFLIFPKVFNAVFPQYMMPLGLFEVSAGLWLLIKGVKSPAAS